MAPIPYPIYISRCPMLYCRSPETTGTCPHYSDEACVAVINDSIRADFQAQKPPFCRAFFFGHLLELEFNTKQEVRADLFYGELASRVIGFDTGPGYDWKKAVVEVYWRSDHQFAWIAVEEHWDHSQPSPLARWLCRRADIARAMFTTQEKLFKISTSAGEELEISLGLDGVQSKHDAAESARAFSTWLNAPAGAT